jgi:hypothetical protein
MVKEGTQAPYKVYRPWEDRNASRFEKIYQKQKRHLIVLSLFKSAMENIFYKAVQKESIIHELHSIENLEIQFEEQLSQELQDQHQQLRKILIGITLQDQNG